MKMLVTGGAGFIGAHLCRKLLSYGHEVYCLDNFHNSSISNIKDFLDHKHFSFIEQDVRWPIEDKKYDVVYHLACPASPKIYSTDPVYTITTAFEGTKSVLNLSHSGSKIIVASTSEIYGDPHIHPQDEKYFGNVNPVGPRSCYDEGKRASESLCWSWRYRYGSDIRIVRLFNVYGPGMSSDDGRMIPNFISQAISGKPLTIYGDGSQTRSLCYVSDVVNFFLKVAYDSNKNYDFGIPVFNVGNPDEKTVLEVAKYIINEWKLRYNVDLSYEFCSSMIDDPSRRKPNINRAKKYLDWEPKVSYLDGMSMTIDWFVKS